MTLEIGMMGSTRAKGGHSAGFSETTEMMLQTGETSIPVNLQWLQRAR